MFNENEFVNDLLYKASKKKIDITYELEQFKRYQQIEYLYIVKRYVDELKVEDIPISLRMRGASSLIAYILGIHNVSLDDCSISNTLFFESEYKDEGIGPRFDINVPRRDKDKAIKLLNRLFEIDVSKSNASIFYLKEYSNYRIGIYGNELLERTVDAIHIVNYNTCVINWFKEDFSKLNDKACMKFMLMEDHKGFCLPNLNGCIFGIPSEFYELMEIGKPIDLYELAIINSLNQSIFVSRKKLIKYIKEEGLRNVIYDKNQLLDILTNIYDISKDIALELIEHAFKTNRLSERDELILDSVGVSKSIQAQMINIKYLYAFPASLEDMRFSYYLAQIKDWLPGEFEELIPVPYQHSYVGPFFYINNKLYAYKDEMTNHNGNVRFFDAPISHMDYFDTLGIDGDYGNYPRGRVIFNNFCKRFFVFMDKDLMNDDIKKLITNTYHLEDRQVVFKRDAHYTHDGL